MKKSVFLFITLTLAACNRHEPVDLTKNADAVKKYKLVAVERGSVGSVIKLPGELKPYETVDIYPKVNGFIKEMYVDRGSRVQKGQLLMTLEAPEINQQLQAAYSKFVQTQKDLSASRDRFMRLTAASKTPGAVSELDLVNAKARFEADSASEKAEEANVSAAQTLKDYLTVKAPFDGIIIERNIHPGALTGPSFKQENKPLLILENDRRLRLEIFIPEEFTEKVSRKNDSVSFTTDAWPGKIFTAPIARSSNSIYDNFRSEAIEADVFNTHDQFKPGMYVEAEVPVNSTVNSWLVPASAIISSTEHKYVIAEDNGRAKYIDVKEGISNSGKTEVYGDFMQNEAIIANPDDELKQGDLVK